MLLFLNLIQVFIHNFRFSIFYHFLIVSYPLCFTQQTNFMHDNFFNFPSILCQLTFIHPRYVPFSEQNSIKRVSHFDKSILFTFFLVIIFCFFLKINEIELFKQLNSESSLILWPKFLSLLELQFLYDLIFNFWEFFTSKVLNTVYFLHL